MGQPFPRHTDTHSAETAHLRFASFAGLAAVSADLICRPPGRIGADLDAWTGPGDHGVLQPKLSPTAQPSAIAPGHTGASPVRALAPARVHATISIGASWFVTLRRCTSMRPLVHRVRDLAPARVHATVGASPFVTLRQRTPCDRCIRTSRRALAHQSPGSPGPSATLLRPMVMKDCRTA